MDAADAMKMKAAKKNPKKQKMNKSAFRQKNTNSFFYFIQPIQWQKKS